MTYRELRRKLERQASGPHEIWLNPANELQTPPDAMQGASQFSNYEVAYLNGIVRWDIINGWAERIAICIGHQ